MKKVILLLLSTPFLLATQCEDEENIGFETNYIIENQTGIDLYLLRPENRFLKIPGQSSEFIGSDLNSDTEPIPPEETTVIEGIQLFERVNEDFILRYDQNPLDNEQWIFEETEINRFEYRLLINSALLD